MGGAMGSGEGKKAHWVSWDVVCRSKNRGGLGVRKLEEFNWALLGKWRWGLMIGSNSLWARVIRSRYGHTGQGSESGKRGGDFTKGSAWWKDLGIVLEARRGIGSWFSAGIKRVVGDGRQTLFWHDIWADELPLSVKYNRLFLVSKGKTFSIEQLGEWTGATWSWKLPWRRRLFQWETQQLRQLQADITKVIIKKDRADSWEWRYEDGGRYTAKSAYKALTAEPGLSEMIWCKQIWKCPAPQKVLAFTWQLLLGRLQTRSNIARRNIQLGENGVICPMCREKEETEGHLFFTCDFAAGIWSKCCRWWGQCTARISDPARHLQQHRGLPEGRNARRMGVLIWMASVWTIWLERNKVVFEGFLPDTQRAMDMIQLRSWFWIKVKQVGFACLLSKWILDPNSCLQIKTP